MRVTSPVGIFAAGDTPEGLADMTGNVWEWTRDRYEGYPIRSEDGRDEATSRQRRVLRGGAFDSPRRDVRAAARDNPAPAGRLNDVGFRVSCELSPIADAAR